MPTTAPASPGVTIPRASWMVWALVSCGTFAAFLDVTIANTAFPAIQTAFAEQSLSHLSWVINAYNVVFAALLIPAGRVADRLGDKRTFIGAVLLFVTGSLGCVLAGSADALIAARVAQAAGAAGIVPSSLALVLTAFPAERRVTATVAWAAIGALAASTGPVLGSVVVEYSGWRTAFAINLLLLLTVPVALRVLRERRAPSSGAPDLWGGLLLAAGVGALALGIVESPDWGWTGPAALACWSASALALAGLVAHVRRAADPIVDLGLLRAPGFAAATAGALIFCVALFGIIFGNIQFLTRVAGYSILEAGLAGGLGPLVTTIVMSRIGGAIERGGGRVAGAAGCVLMALAAAGYARAGADGRVDFLAEWLAPVIIFGVGCGLSMAAFIGGSIVRVPEPLHNQANAINSSARQVGAVLGVAVFIAAASERASDAADFAVAYWLCGGIALVGAVVALRLAGPEPAHRAGRDDAFPRHEAIVHGHRMAYRVTGSGPPLVLIHGFFDSSDSFGRLARKLADRYTVIAPDLLGHGDSAAPPNIEYSPNAHAVSIRKLLDVLGHERVLIGGWSYGGGVAIAFATTFRPCVDGLVLISPGAGVTAPGITNRPRGPLALMASPVGPMVAWTLTRHPLWGALSAVVRSGPPVLRVLHGMVGRLRQRDARRAAFRTLSTSVALRRYRISADDQIAQLAGIPTLVVWGRDDGVIPAVTGEEYVRRVPSIRLQVIDGGHLLHGQRSAAVAEAIRVCEFGAADATPAVTLAGAAT